jgi:hypothetical protein
MTRSLPVPHSITDLTPEWMTTAISRRCPDAVVGEIDIGDIEDGTNRRASIQLSYLDGDGPRSVFVKVQGRTVHRLALWVLGAWSTEARFAESGADRPLEHPRPYAAAINRRRLATIVVMDDVTTYDGIPNDGVQELSVAEARDGLAGLANLHAAYWDRALPPELQFLQPWRMTRKLAPLSAANLSRGLRRLATIGEGGLIPATASVRSLETGFRHSSTLAGSGPQTLLHGDPHPANTYALPGARTGFYDWQLARTGHWSHDFGYFLAGSLTVEDRRQNERDLLAGYLEVLAGHGVSAPSINDAWERYRATPIYGLTTWIHTIAAGTFQPVDTCVATIRRFAAAYDDLETATTLPR